MAVGGVELIVCQPLGHGSLGKSVRQDCSAGEFQGFGDWSTATSCWFELVNFRIML